MLSLIVTLVAGHTVLGAGGLKAYSAPRNVTCSALGPLMGPLELEAPREGGVIEGANLSPGVWRMAGQAVGRKIQSNMIHLFGRGEVFLVASQTIGRQGAEAATFVIGVAAFARDLKVGSLEEKTRGLVNVQALHISEGCRRMACGAVGGKRSAMDIRVAGPALVGAGLSLLEVKVFVAGAA